MKFSQLSDEEVLGTNIIAELGLEALPEERRIGIINKLSELVQQRVMLQIAEKLSEADALALEKLINEKGESDPAVANFIVEKIPTMPDIVRAEIVAVKKELVEHMDKAQH